MKFRLPEIGGILAACLILTGCTGSPSSVSGELNTDNLLFAEESRAAENLNRRQTVRVAVCSPELTLPGGLMSFCEKKGWKIQLLHCPPEKAAVWLRNGTADAALIPLSDDEAERLNLLNLYPNTWVAFQRYLSILK